ncbi:unnamed protein product [Prorocentrum cordatum]|uniref:Uncharacterized protein n=1 Tax=Prorocentrum cordatum TaxID=2364126 RepID=A0ABN9TDN4_9DINO|nr:unnamed protein product [Polarella glacialis]
MSAAGLSRRWGASHRRFPLGRTTGGSAPTGGWVMYAVDQAGVYLFGAAWTVTATFLGLLSATGILAPGGAQSPRHLRALQLGSWAVSRVFCLCARRRAPGDAELDELLPLAPPQPTAAKWCGQAAGPGTTTEHFRPRVKGRGSKRKFNDLPIWHQGQVARRRLNFDEVLRVDRKGLLQGSFRFDWI